MTSTTQPPDVRPADGRAAVVTGLADALAVATELAAGLRDEAARRDAERILPTAEVEEMTRRGLYGLTVPAWLGGPDLPMSATAEPAFSSTSESNP